MFLRIDTGQRPADVRKIKPTDMRDGALWIVQNKASVIHSAHLFRLLCDHDQDVSELLSSSFLDSVSRCNKDNG